MLQMPISRTYGVTLGLLLILFVGPTLACYELTEGTATASERLLLNGTFSQVLKCTGVSSLLIVPYLWKPIAITVDCGKLQTFQVYMGPSPDALVKRYTNREQAWCSLSSLFQSGCQLQMSPFATSYVGIRKIFSTGVACRVARHDQLSSLMLGSCVAGALVFLWASYLSESLALRVTSGGLMFALGSVIILIYVLARQMPGRRSMSIAATLMGSSSWAVVRWLTGHWLPSTYALLHNRWLLGYLAMSSLFGAAVTYLYGGVENAKLNTLMRVGLQLLGLLLMYMGMWTLPPVFATLLGVLMVMQAMRVAEPFMARFRTSLPGRLMFGAPAPAPFAQHEPVGTPQGPGSSAVPRVGQLQPVPYNGTRLDTGSAAAPPHTPITPMQPTYVPVGPAGAVRELAAAVSSMVRTGNIINPLSGHSIKIGGDLFNQLIEQGYTPDMAAGRLQPPPSTPGAGGSPEGTAADKGASSWLRRRKSMM
ncbi:hypothetical protein Agub_g1476 [Astrephomene gubernaculifera]|uniref:Nuclear envelope integral membrane protein 1 n=1 Tax=Astrephomene gubernaculifera TaxID=47775 RepID=A0AAD3HHN8_9CHLO|nr:hypothetical protein Agub_g1476 [Astrephomene gubernaculifera]